MMIAQQTVINCCQCKYRLPRLRQMEGKSGADELNSKLLFRNLSEREIYTDKSLD